MPTIDKPAILTTGWPYCLCGFRSSLSASSLPAARGLFLWANNPLGTRTVARPSKYKPEYAEQAQKLCQLGATDAQLADFFKVAVSTVSLWKVQHPEFSDALKVAKEKADQLVEQSLFRRATGYECDEVDVRVISGEVVQTQLRKFYPPDTTAAIFWLKNRKPAEWRDKVETELSGTVKYQQVRRTVVDPAK